MALDKLVDSIQLDGALGATADAIRAKTGSEDPLTWDMDTGFDVAIEDIVTLNEGTANDTAVAYDIRRDKTAHVKGALVTGTMPDGEYKAGYKFPSNSVVTVSLSLDAAAKNSYGFTTTKPSGTTGTNFLTINPGATATIWRVTPTASITTGGYIPSGSKDGSIISNQPIVHDAATVYVPVRTVSFAGGALSEEVNTNEVTTTPTVTVSSDGTFFTKTGYGVTDTQPDGTDGTDYLTVTGSGSTSTVGVATSNYQVNRAITTYTNSPGVIAVHSRTTALGADSKVGSKTVDITPSITGGFTNYIPIVTASFAGGAISGSTTTAITVSGMDTSSSSTKYYIDAAATGSVTRAKVTYTNLAGAIAAHSASQALAKSSAYNVGSSATRVFIPEATFANKGTQDIEYTDISSEDTSPILVSGDYLYINKGYTDNVKISLKKLVPDEATSTLAGDHILSGYSAYNNDGAIVAGTISQKAAATYYTSTSDQTIAAGQYLKGAQTIKAVTTANISAANIKSGVTIKVGDSGSATRIANVTGTFTNDATAEDGDILYGKTAYVAGTKKTGTIATLVASDLTVSDNVVTVPVNKYTGASTATALTATVGLGTVVSGSGTVTSLSIAASGTSFKVTGSADVSAPTVSTAGYVSSSKGTKSKKTGGATVNATIAKIIGSTTVTGDAQYKPVISKASVPGGVTDAANGAATTGAPSSGVYIAVKSAANTGTLTITPNVTTSGYGTSAAHGISGTTATVGASASDTTYVAIKTQTPSFDGGALSGGSTATFTGLTTTTSDTGIKVQTAYTASRGAVLYNGAVSGWVTATDNATALAAGSKDSTNGTSYFISAATIPVSKNFTVTTTANSNTDGTGLTVTNNKNRKVTISNKASGTAALTNAASATATVTNSGSVTVTNSGTATVTSGSATAGSLTVAAYDTSSSTATTSQSVVTNGVWTAPSVTASGTYYGRVVVGAGTYSSSATQTAAGAITPSVGLDDAATANYGFTTTKPSGTTGTNYLTIDPGAAVTTKWKVTPKAIVSAAGYVTLNTAGTNGTALEGSPTINAGTNYYVPVVTPSFSGGGLTPTNYSKTNLAVTLASGSDTNMTNITVGAQSTGTYPYYFKVSGSTPAVSGSTKVERAAITYTNSGGVIAAHTSTNTGSVLAAGSSSPTVSVNAASGSTYISLKKATVSVSGSTNTVTPSASISSANTVILTTNDNGLAITATGGGSASAAVKVKTNTTGYAPAAASSTDYIGTGTITADLTTKTATKYVSGVVLTAPTSGSREFSITVPNGADATITFLFSVDSNGNVTVTES